MELRAVPYLLGYSLFDVRGSLLAHVLTRSPIGNIKHFPDETQIYFCEKF